MDISNLIGLIIVLIPVILLAYLTCRNLAPKLGIEWLDERFSGNVKNVNFDNPNWKNEVFYRERDGQILPTNPISAPVFSVEKFDNQVKGVGAVGVGGDDRELMETEVRESTLDNPQWLGGVFYQKRNEYGEAIATNPPLVGGMVGNGAVSSGGLDDTNNLIEGFMDIGIGEALRDGYNTLMGKGNGRDIESVNPAEAYSGVVPLMPSTNPKKESILRAPTAAVKLVDDKPEFAQHLDNKMRGEGQSMEDINATMTADKAHSDVISDKIDSLLGKGMKHIVDKSQESSMSGRATGFGGLGVMKKPPIGMEKSVLQQLYGGGEAKGTIKSGKRKFADDVDSIKPVVSGVVDCEAYPVMRGGKIVQVIIRNNGNDYKKAPKVKLVGGDAKKEAVLKAVIDGGGGVVIVDIIESGEGYQKVPDIKFLK